MRWKDIKTYAYDKILRISMENRLGKGCYIPTDSRILGKEYITIGDNFFSYGNLRIEVFKVKGKAENPQLLIGRNVAVGNYCHIGVINRVEIGNGVLMGSNVLITDHMHGDVNDGSMRIPPNERPLISKGNVMIGNDVFIGDGVKIMPNVQIGNGVIIGANSVVTHDIESFSVVAGIPAKRIK